MDAKDNTIAIAQIGKTRVVGLVHVLKATDGQDLPVFFTGHADEKLPMLFITDDPDPSAIKFELTGETPQQTYEDHDIVVYCNVARQVFEANPEVGKFDSYAELNAAFYMKESGLFSPDQFTSVTMIDREVAQAAATACLASKADMDGFVALVRKKAGETLVH